MAITYDATSGNIGLWVTSDSFAHTCTGDDRLLLAWVFFDRGNGAYNVSSLSYGGASLTQFETYNNGNEYVELWRLVNPAAGSNTIVATYNNIGPTAKAAIRVVSYTGVNQTTPLGTLVSAAGTSKTPSVTVSSASGEVVADFVDVYSAGFNLAVGDDQTARWEGDAATNGLRAFGISDESGAASVTMSWSIATTDSWMIGAVPIKPVGAASPSGIPKTTKQTLMGVG